MSETTAPLTISSVQVMLFAILYLCFASFTYATSSTSTKEDKRLPRVLAMCAARSIFLGTITYHLGTLVPLYVISVGLQQVFSTICQAFCGCSFAIATAGLIHAHHPCRLVTIQQAQRWINGELIAFSGLVAFGVVPGLATILYYHIQLHPLWMGFVDEISRHRGL